MCRIFLGIFFLILGGCSEPNVKPIITGREGMMIPELNLQLQDGVTFFNTSDIKKGGPTILFFFTPGCPFCRMETRRIVNNITEIKNIKFCLVTNAPLKDIKEFSKLYGLNEFNNIVIGRDTNYRVPRVPFLAVYGSNKLMINSFIGVLPVKQLIGFKNL